MFVVDTLRPVLFGPYSFSLKSGECLAVKGPSGSGKTLLLRALADLDPSQGSITYDQKDRATMSGPQWRQIVRYVATEPGWWDEIAGAHFADPDGLATTIQAVGLPEDVMSREIAILSTGERQRLAILRALESDPEVLLLDEPTAALDQKSAKAIESLLKAALLRGCIIVMVTHSPAQAKRFATQTLKLTGITPGGDQP